MSQDRSMGPHGASNRQTLSSGMAHSDDSHSMEAVSQYSGPSSAATTSQTVPHRAWEEGYQSPFSQTSTTPVITRELRQFQHHLEPLSDHSSSNAHTPPRQSPLPSHPSASTLVTQNTPKNVSAPATMPPAGQQYRRRMPKVITQEVGPDDTDVSTFVTLGISPFMAGQDIIANQNRFVRNESTFARHFVRLQRTIAESEARHAQTEQDIYKHLEQHKIAFDKLAGSSGRATPIASNASRYNLRSDPDFLALEKAHQETCARLEELSRQVAVSSEAIQRALIDLSQRLDHIFSQSRESL